MGQQKNRLRKESIYLFAVGVVVGGGAVVVEPVGAGLAVGVSPVGLGALALAVTRSAVPSEAHRVVALAG